MLAKEFLIHICAGKTPTNSMINPAIKILGSFYLLTGKKKLSGLKPNDIKNIAYGVMLIMFIQNIAILFYDNSIYLTLLFILVFFLSGIFIPVYLRYNADLSLLLLPSGIKISFSEFCSKYEISKREKEVISEICDGMTNQQIADKLFISLQTVKDHTHRIYIKTNCNSRTQLIRMVMR